MPHRGVASPRGGNGVWQFSSSQHEHRQGAAKHHAGSSDDSKLRSRYWWQPCRGQREGRRWVPAPPPPPDSRRRTPRLAALACRLAQQLQPRFQVVLACFLATLTAYVERVGFSIAFTAMAEEVGRRAGGWRRKARGLRCRPEATGRPDARQAHRQPDRHAMSPPLPVK